LYIVFFLKPAIIIIVKRKESSVKALTARSVKKIKKPLDKSLGRCYNKTIEIKRKGEHKND